MRDFVFWKNTATRTTLLSSLLLPNAKPPVNKVLNWIKRVFVKII